MKLGVIGQCKGGNAALWFELFNEDLNLFTSITELKYICRNENELNGVFDIKELYGKKPTLNGALYLKLRRFFYSKIIAPIYFNYQLPSEKFDVIHIQGNYSPSFNLKVISKSTAKIVLQIMGSDFYQNYLKQNLSPREKTRFIEVLHKSDHIVCTRESSKNDLIKEFPFIKDKLSIIRLGTSKKWLKKTTDELLKIKSVNNSLNFLSARGLYNYNNVEVLVEAFCKVFKDQKNAKLYIINGYGNHKSNVDKVKQIIQEYGCSNIVELRINQWISDEELMKYYEISDYNFCIGQSDQLSISITYGFLTAATNVLSPLNTYQELKKSGYESVEILKKIDVQTLTKFFSQLPLNNNDKIISDREKASVEHISTVNFKKYVELYNKLIEREI